MVIVCSKYSVIEPATLSYEMVKLSYYILRSRSIPDSKAELTCDSVADTQDDTQQRMNNSSLQCKMETPIAHSVSEDSTMPTMVDVKTPPRASALPMVGVWTVIV